MAERKDEGPLRLRPTPQLIPSSPPPLGQSFVFH